MMPISFRNAWAAAVAALVLLGPVVAMAQPPDVACRHRMPCTLGRRPMRPAGKRTSCFPTCRRSGSSPRRPRRAHPPEPRVWSSAWPGFAFGLVDLHQLQRLPVHRSMREISELIYETCKTYLITQGKFILMLELFIGGVIVALLRRPAAASTAVKVAIILLVQPGRHRRQLRRRVVRHPHQHLRQLPHGVRQPRGQALPGLRHPAQGRDEHRHAAHLGRAAPDAVHPAVRSRRLRRARASSASPSASRSARRRCASPAASSPRSPTSAPT